MQPPTPPSCQPPSAILSCPPRPSVPSWTYAIYKGKLDGPALKGLLDRIVVQTAQDYYDVEHAERWWLLHDNSPQFKSGVVQRWVHGRGIQMIDFPACSPDVNIIENLWPRV